MSDLRDELAEALFDVIDHERADDWMQYEVREACTLAADAILPIIERETERARAESEAKARHFANLLGNQAKHLNDVLPAEIIRQKADAWDEGHKAGCADPYARYGQCDCGPNPYRPEPCPTCGGRNGGHSMPCTGTLWGES